MRDEIQTASDMLTCPSISESVRATLSVMWGESWDAFDDGRDVEAMQIILDIQAVWATHSTYAN